MLQQTMVLIKPDGVRRRLVGEIIDRFEHKGLLLMALKMIRISEDLAREHYREHVGKEFFPPLLEFITSGPVVAMVLEGEDAVGVVRTMMGATCHIEAVPGTIRGDYSFSNRENLVHGSDSPESAEREISLFFSSEELVGEHRVRYPSHMPQ